MSLLKGPLTITRCTVTGPVPTEDELLSTLSNLAFHPFMDGTKDETSGFVNWLNPLMPPEATIMDGWGILSIRVDKRRIPTAIFNAHVGMKLKALKEAKDLAFIGKEALQSIRDEVKTELLQKQTPSTKILEAAWNLKTGTLHVFGGKSAVAAFRGALTPAFGVAITPVFQECFDVVGGEMLPWLWYRSQECGGQVAEDDQTSIFINDRIDLAMGDKSSAKEITLKKGSPAESKEALDALRHGAEITAATFVAMDGAQEYKFTLKAMGMAISGLTLPASSSTDPFGRAADRLFLLGEFFVILDARVAFRMSEAHGHNEAEKVVGWISTGAGVF